MGHKITKDEKIKMYEGLLHDLQMFYAVTLNSAQVKKLLDNIAAWSYAHRQGNGELTDKEQQEHIDFHFTRLRDRL